MTLSAATIAGLTPASAQDADAPVYRRVSAPLDARVDDLIARMTLDEKIALLAGASSMTTNGVPRLGVPGIKMTDGPTGVRSPEGKPATVFPVGVAIAATWNPALATRVGGAIAEEARADGASVLLAPTVNIVRTPRWGRNFETYSEDPYLTAQIALGYVRGVQREGIGVSLKHFVANNQETNRFFVDVQVSERALRELYFPAFEAVVKQADPWSVMASYNKVNGTYVSQNRLLLTDVLKKDWGFPGAVVSDWGATHSTAPAANAGLDLEMPGPPAQFGAKLRKAVDAGEVAVAQIDDNARRVLRMILRSGVLDRAPSAPAPARNHADVARDAAEEAIVLLKNQAVLPLGSDIRTLAVIGPNAASARMQGGGSSEVVPFDAIASPLEALRAAYPGVRITYAQGVDNEETPPAADAALFSPDAGHAEHGLQASYFAAADFAGDPVRSARETRFIKRISGNVASANVIGYAALRWEGWLWPRRSGRHELSIRGTGSATLILDGKTILDKSVKGVPDARDVIGFPVLRRTVALDLEAGRGYRIRLDYATGQTPYEALAFGLREPAPSLDEAVAAARGADAAIVLVGSSSTTEGEGYDRPTLALPGGQDRLVAAVAAANPRTVVVVNSGAAVTMPWRDQVPAILQLWFPGQEGAQALAAILAGRVNPSGKLPVTFPASDADDRADLSTIRSDYSEDLLVGYRRFDTTGAAPLFAFGRGLSYSRFGYSALKAPRRVKGGAALKVRFLLRNEAGPAGKEVVQLYVAPAERSEGEPVRQLRAFAKVALAPGKQRMVTLTIEPRAFATWDEAERRWRVRPGSYVLQVGGGSDDVRLHGEVMVGGGDAFVP